MYDVIIVGSGPSGLTAAIYTTRAGLKTLVIAGSKWGGQLQLTTEVENFPGFPQGIQGPELMLAMRKQAEKFGAEFIDDDFAGADFTTFPKGGPFKLTAGGKELIGKTVLIATGADSKTLGVPGEKELTGHGISYCATCDGAFFRGKDIIVVGGGDSAMEEANFLTNFASSVTIVHRRDTFKSSVIMSERCQKNPKIKFLLNSQIAEVLGQGKVESVRLESRVMNQELRKEIETRGKVISEKDETLLWEMPIAGVFVAIGHTPNTKVFQGISVDERGFVLKENGTNTNIEGIFVSGDVQDSRYMQAITAAGFGCMAALDIEKYLVNKS